MASFQDHINQYEHNRKFLSSISLGVPDCIDWQVTTCFYTALQLIDAHLANHNEHFQKHIDVQKCISPGSGHKAELASEIYTAYRGLENLSRIARYLNNPTGGTTGPVASKIKMKHLAQAIGRLDKITKHFSKSFALDPKKCKLRCSEISVHENFDHFEIEGAMVEPVTVGASQAQILPA